MLSMEAQSSFPISPLPASPSELPSPALSPPPRPPRPESSLSDLKPRVITSPARSSRPFDPFVVQQIKNAPAQLSKACSNPKSEVSVSAFRFSCKISLDRSLGESDQSVEEVAKLKGVPRHRCQPLQSARKTAHTQSTSPSERQQGYQEIAPGRPFTLNSIIDHALARSPLHIPSPGSSPALSMQTSRISTEHDPTRDVEKVSPAQHIPCVDITKQIKQLKSWDVTYAQPSTTYRGEIVSSGHITTLPPISHDARDHEARRMQNVGSVSSFSTRSRAESVHGSRCENGSVDNHGTTNVVEKDFQVDQATTSPTTYKNPYSSCSLSHRSFYTSFTARSPTFDTGSMDYIPRISWRTRYKTHLWIVTTVLVVLIATVSIMAGIVVKLSVFASTTKANNNAS